MVFLLMIIKLPLMYDAIMKNSVTLQRTFKIRYKRVKGGSSLRGYEPFFLFVL